MTIIASDPGSQTATSVNAWDYPLPRLEAMVADLWDLGAPHTYKKPKPYPRPFPEQRAKKRHGNVASRTPDEVKAILRRFGPASIQAPV